MEVLFRKSTFLSGLEMYFDLLLFWILDLYVVGFCLQQKKNRQMILIDYCTPKFNKSCARLITNFGNFVFGFFVILVA